MMRRTSKNLSWLLAICVSCLTGCGGGDAPEVAISSEKSDPVIEVTPTGLTIAGKHVGLPTATTDWESALGNPRRAEASSGEPGEYRLLLWDQFGIAGYERIKSSKITRIDVFLETPRDRQTAPRESFPGTLIIAETKIDGKTTPASLNKRLSAAPLLPLARFPNHWQTTYGPWTMTLVTNVRGDEIVEVSLSQ